VAVVLGHSFSLRQRPKLGCLHLVILRWRGPGTAIWPLQAFVSRKVASDVPLAAQGYPCGPSSRPSATAVPRFPGRRGHQAVRASCHRAQFQRRAMETLVPNTSTLFGIAGFPVRRGHLTRGRALAGGQGRRSVAAQAGWCQLRMLGIEAPQDPAQRVGTCASCRSLAWGAPFRVEQPCRASSGRAKIVSRCASVGAGVRPEIVSGVAALLSPEGGAQALPGPAGRPGDCQLDTLATARFWPAAMLNAGGGCLCGNVSAGLAGRGGWPAPLCRCNLLMRAVPVAAGTHTIRCAYSPPGLVGAAIVSATASLLLLA